ncbi:MAG: hypothetical protein MZV49_12130 [Rhodopseudomonas palustris]|nr:hypothetical protein [Rhodopseudomonas palustris]
MLAPDHCSPRARPIHVAIAMAPRRQPTRVVQLIETANRKLTEICADEFQKSSSSATR